MRLTIIAALAAISTLAACDHRESPPANGGGGSSLSPDTCKENVKCQDYPDHSEHG